MGPSILFFLVFPKCGPLDASQFREHLRTFQDKLFLPKTSYDDVCCVHPNPSLIQMFFGPNMLGSSDSDNQEVSRVGGDK